MKITEDHATYDFELNSPSENLLPENYLWMYVIERFLKDLAGFAQQNWQAEQTRALLDWFGNEEWFYEVVFERSGLSVGSAEWVWQQIKIAVVAAEKKERNDPLRLSEKAKKILEAKRDKC